MLFCFQTPFQTPERITIQWYSLSSGETRAEPHPCLVLTPIIGKNSREDADGSTSASWVNCLNHWTITQVVAISGNISNILDNPLVLHCHIYVCNATSSSSQSLCKKGKLLASLSIPQPCSYSFSDTASWPSSGDQEREMNNPQNN